MPGFQEKTEEWATASAAGDTVALRGVQLTSATAQSLATLLRWDTCISTYEVSETNCSDEHLQMLLGPANHLESISLAQTKVTDKGVMELAEHCRNIRTVNLEGCSEVTDKGVAKLAEHCKDLNTVNLVGCSKVTDVSVAQLEKQGAYICRL